MTTPSYTGIDCDASRTVQINLPPEAVHVITQGMILTTFGQRIQTILPLVTDVEGDDILYSFKDQVNPFLSFEV